MTPHNQSISSRRTSQQRFHDKRKALGLCRCCGKKTERERSLCDACGNKAMSKRGAIPNRNGPYAGSRSASRLMVCRKCGEEFSPDGLKKYCSICRTKPCRECGIVFEMEDPKIASRYRYCSKGCKHKAQRKMTGYLAGGWRGGIADANKIERGRMEYREWRDAVFKRDDYTCQDCGQRGADIHAHHLKPFSKYPKLRTVVSNGVTLCETCHHKRHKWKRRKTVAGEEYVNGQPVPPPDPQ